MVCVIMLVVIFVSFFTSACLFWFFFFKQKTAYEMRISDWSSDVCSSDLRAARQWRWVRTEGRQTRYWKPGIPERKAGRRSPRCCEIGRASCRERVCQYV